MENLSGKERLGDRCLNEGHLMALVFQPCLRYNQPAIMYWSILHMARLHYKDQSVNAVQEHISFFGAFAKQFHSPSVCPSSRNSSIYTRWMCVKIHIRDFGRRVQLCVSYDSQTK